MYLIEAYEKTFNTQQQEQQLDNIRTTLDRYFYRTERLLKLLKDIKDADHFLIDTSKMNCINYVNPMTC